MRESSYWVATVSPVFLQHVAYLVEVYIKTVTSDIPTEKSFDWSKVVCCLHVKFVIRHNTEDNGVRCLWLHIGSGSPKSTTRLNVYRLKQDFTRFIAYRVTYKFHSASRWFSFIPPLMWQAHLLRCYWGDCYGRDLMPAYRNSSEWVQYLLCISVKQKF